MGLPGGAHRAYRGAGGSQVTATRLIGEAEQPAWRDPSFHYIIDLSLCPLLFFPLWLRVERVGACSWLFHFISRAGQVGFEVSTHAVSLGMLGELGQSLDIVTPRGLEAAGAVSTV